MSESAENTAEAAPAAKAGKGGKTMPAKSGSGKLILLMTIFGASVPFCLPTLIVCVGLLPTLVALLTDDDPRRPSVVAIGYMNLAGVMPFLIDLWMKGQSMDVALGLIRQPFTWAVMLGAAGVGHMILYAVPQAVASYELNRQSARLKTLREGMEQLEKIWGDEVTTATPIDIVRQKLGAE